ncbi:MAG: ribosome small subunit-dependent GTPase A [Clostridiales bacterium]|nr:ribosome small subunit-dependent GTPase A [Clostridiales bacterium]
MQGKIIRGIAGFYYVHIEGKGIYECKAKGVFRKDHKKPLVGDNVEIDVLSEEEKLGNISVLLQRKNALIRPAVANIDQALVIFAAAKPEPNFNLLDRFLIMMEQQGLHSTICFNKLDIISEEEKARLKSIYEPCGYTVLFVSAREEKGIDSLKELLTGKTTAVAGPSGVGKSSLVNTLQSHTQMETGAISEKIERGRHTTRHTELISIEQNTYIMDTPGFSSLNLAETEKEELKDYYPEFAPYHGACRFQGCVHIHEPDCAVKRALEAGKIHRMRYDNYVLLYEELKNRRRY